MKQQELVIVGTICARGGSKGVPRKNVRPLAGIPLIAHTIRCAQACSIFQRIVVSTDDQEIAEGGGSLGKIARINTSGRNVKLDRVRIEVACDVDNPLTGPKGAARVYGKQKGATTEQIRVLDKNLKHFARMVRRDLGIDVDRVSGAGAAGGLGAGLMAFLGAELRPGIDLVADAIRLPRRLAGCDLVITGEGRTDGQTLHGKAPMGVIREARKQGIPVIVISGSIGPGAEAVLDHGAEAYFSASPEPMDENEIRRRGPELLVDCAAQVAREMAANVKKMQRRFPVLQTTKRGEPS